MSVVLWILERYIFLKNENDDAGAMEKLGHLGGRGIYILFTHIDGANGRARSTERERNGMKAAIETTDDVVRRRR